jgi:hypothetical protein
LSVLFLFFIFSRTLFAKQTIPYPFSQITRFKQAFKASVLTYRMFWHAQLMKMKKSTKKSTFFQKNQFLGCFHGHGRQSDGTCDDSRPQTDQSPKVRIFIRQ